MSKPNNPFPFKIVLSYVVLGALAAAVSYLLYTEYQLYVQRDSDPETEKIIETGTLINDLYETDSFSRIALLTKDEKDFESYVSKSDSLVSKIEALKLLITDPEQLRQLDTVASLLGQKILNIEQLRLLKLTSEQDTTLDDILNEFKKFNTKTGRYNLDDIIEEPEKLSPSLRRAWQKWTDYFTEENLRLDTLQVKSMTIDSLLTISRYIVLEAKIENSKTRRALQKTENELLQNELNISSRLRQIIINFDSEITKNNVLNAQDRLASEERTKKILRISGIAGLLLMLLFSYLLVSDYFKAEKFKKRLQREKEYSDELLKSREQLMATVSHDLKTPLNTIVGYSELFTHTDLTKKQYNYTQQIASSAHFISKMADDLLDFSKLEAGKLVIEKAPFSLENVLHQIAKSAKDLHLQKPIDLHLFIDEELKGQLFESDPLRIQQVVHNLLSNAYKFTEKGRIQITASLLHSAKNNYTTEIAVHDSGIGISEEKQQLIFKEFTQAEKDTFQKFGGSGLGLAISRKIAMLLGGKLEVESKLGEGSTFFFTLPLKKVAASKVPVNSDKKIRSDFGLTAILFDDDPAMLKLLRELFLQMNISAKGYTQFQDFAAESKGTYDFVLTDIEMPTFSGFEVLNALTQNGVSGYKGQPIIAMTGTKKYDREEFIAFGFTDVLQKPFTKNQLVAALSPLFINKIESDLPALEAFKNPTNEIYDLAFMRSFLSSQESLEEVLQIFYGQSEQDMKTIEKAIAETDCDTMASTAHRMLTMCRQLNAKKVNPILETMERCAMEHPTPAEMNSLFTSLKLALKELLEALQQRPTT